MILTNVEEGFSENDFMSYSVMIKATVKTFEDMLALKKVYFKTM